MASASVLEMMGLPPKHFLRRKADTESPATDAALVRLMSSASLNRRVRRFGYLTVLVFMLWPLRVRSSAPNTLFGSPEGGALWQDGSWRQTTTIL